MAADDTPDPLWAAKRHRIRASIRVFACRGMNFLHLERRVTHPLRCATPSVAWARHTPSARGVARLMAAFLVKAVGSADHEQHRSVAGCRGPCMVSAAWPLVYPSMTAGRRGAPRSPSMRAEAGVLTLSGTWRGVRREHMGVEPTDRHSRDGPTILKTAPTTGQDVLPRGRVGRRWRAPGPAASPAGDAALPAVQHSTAPRVLPVA